MISSPLRVMALAAAALLLAGGTALLAGRTDAGRPVPELPAPVLPAEEAHLPFGRIDPPRPMPDIRLVTAEGSATTLAELLEGRWTLVQLMFAGCSTTCPMQGAIFAATEAGLADSGTEAALLSLTIDPVSDDAAAMRTWLAAQGAGKRWSGATPAIGDLALLLDVLHGRGEGVDVHDARVYLVDPQGRLVYATEDLPDAGAVVSLVREAQAAGS